MRRAPLSITLLGPIVVACLGCDAARDLWEGVGGEVEATATAERPEGWESLEGDAAALRLYYQFVDVARRVRFVERLEDVPEPLRATVGFVKLDVPPPLSPGDAARVRRERREGSGVTAVTASTGTSQIVLYSAEWCGACRKAKRYLSRRGIDYEIRDVDDPHHAAELKRRTGSRAVPVIDIDGRMLTGFSASAYDALIDAK